MKVYELMKELSEMPSGAEVIFHTLVEKDNEAKIHAYSDDDDMYEVNFEDLKIELITNSWVQITD